MTAGRLVLPPRPRPAFPARTWRLMALWGLLTGLAAVAWVVLWAGVLAWR